MSIQFAAILFNENGSSSLKFTLFIFIIDILFLTETNNFLVPYNIINTLRYRISHMDQRCSTVQQQQVVRFWIMYHHSQISKWGFSHAYIHLTTEP